eukprot:182242-Pyramimonas_sp.AAC.1
MCIRDRGPTATTSCPQAPWRPLVPSPPVSGPRHQGTAGERHLAMLTAPARGRGEGSRTVAVTGPSPQAAVLASPAEHPAPPRR